ncbi:MAG: SDR family NAD(P)-dependent oxidoreductase [Sphingomonadaceae bacterium]
MNILKKVVPAGVRRKMGRFLARYAPPVDTPARYEIHLDGQGRLAGQIAIVTGGSGAIGRSICCHLAAEGATVYVCGASHNKINAVVSEIGELGGIAHAQKMDVSDEQLIVSVFDSIYKNHGKIDILVNCAGGSARGDYAPIIQQKTSVIDNLLNINLRGTILCTREGAKAMVEKGYGRIINISSVIGERGKANFSEYAASKGGVIAFTKSIAMELGKYGITANCVSPGIVQRGGVSESDLERLQNTNWLRSYGKPEDSASMVAYLVSEKAAFVTGQNFIVDGGRSLGLKGD